MALERLRKNKTQNKVNEQINLEHQIVQNKDKARLTVYLSSNLAKDLKKIGVENGASVSILIEKAVKKVYNL